MLVADGTINHGDIDSKKTTSLDSVRIMGWKLEILSYMEKDKVTDFSVQYDFHSNSFSQEKPRYFIKHKALRHGVE